MEEKVSEIMCVVQDCREVKRGQLEELEVFEMWCF